MKHIAIIFLFSSLCFAQIQANFNGDEIVNFEDFAIFARDWQKTSGLTDPNTDLNPDGTVDFKDLYIFAQHWLEIIYEPNVRTLTISANTGGSTIPTAGTYTYDFNSYASITAMPDSNYTFSVWTGTAADYGKVNDVNAASTTVLMDSNYTVVANFTLIPPVPPAANDINVSAYTYITYPITLNADGVNFYIVSTPNDVNCYLQDPASGCGKITESLCPYRLRNGGNVVWLAADNNETFSFKYKSNNGLLDSCDVNCFVVVAENPKDCLSFDGQGFVTIPDTNDYFDLIHGRGISLFINTRTPTQKILSKRASATGYELWLINGKPTLKLFDANGIVATISTSLRADNGGWHNLGFIYDSNGYAQVDNCYLDEDEADSSGWVGVPAQSYLNDSNLIIGSGYKWGIDNIRAYNLTLTDSLFIYGGYVTQNRNAAGTLNSWMGITLNPGAVVRFKCNYDGVNNTYTQIYDDKPAHLIGVISDSNHVKYVPWNWYWSDINVLRRNR